MIHMLSQNFLHKKKAHITQDLGYLQLKWIQVNLWIISTRHYPITINMMNNPLLLSTTWQHQLMNMGMIIYLFLFLLMTNMTWKSYFTTNVHGNHFKRHKHILWSIFWIQTLAGRSICLSIESEATKYFDYNTINEHNNHEIEVFFDFNKTEETSKVFHLSIDYQPLGWVWGV